MGIALPCHHMNKHMTGLCVSLLELPGLDEPTLLYEHKLS